MDDSKGLEVGTPNLGGRRGVLSDWMTQRWVQLTGKRVDLSDYPWLEGPIGDVELIGSEEKPGRGWARHVRTLKETIRVYTDAQGTLRADHDLWIWRTRFLRLHYRMRKRASS
jgi:hypothetical protein